MEEAERQILFISNESAQTMKSFADQLLPRQNIRSFRFREGALVDALRRSSAATTVIDLSNTDEYVLEVIGQAQKINPSAPLICLSPRLPAAQAWISRDGSFFFLPTQIAGVPLPPILQRAPTPPSISFRGEFQAESLIEIVQVLLIAGVSGRLAVWRRWSRGELLVHNGAVVHAELGERRGRAAVLSLLEWPRGTFRLHIGRVPAAPLQISLSDPLFRLRPFGSSALPARAEVHELHPADEIPTEGVLPASTALTVPESDLDVQPEGTMIAPSFPPAAGDSDLSPWPASGPTPEPAPDELPTAEDPQSLESSLDQAWLQINAADLLNETEQKERTMAVTSSTMKDALSKLEQNVEGFVGAAVADSESGMCMSAIGGAGVLNIEVAAAGNTEVVRAKRKIMKTLNLRDEIEDILISLGKQYHLIRLLRARPTIFIYLAVDRMRANLAMARYALTEAEREIGV